MLHRLRERLICEKVSITNQARGLLIDFGISFPKGREAFEQTMLDG